MDIRVGVGYGRSTSQGFKSSFEWDDKLKSRKILWQGLTEP